MKITSHLTRNVHNKSAKINLVVYFKVNRLWKSRASVTKQVKQTTENS